MEKQHVLCIFFILTFAGSLFAQDKTPRLFQYGVANAFIDGLYEGQLSVDQLKHYGNFGIGAPNNIDGELTMIDGKAYQSTADGKTSLAPKTLLTPFAFVTNFSAATTYNLADITDVKDLFTRIEALLPNPNAIYAVHIKGTYSSITTRAFPPVRQRPYQPLGQLLDKQKFFELKDSEGDMVGFYFPAYLAGINIVGLHFHFLSGDRKSGGHVVSVRAKSLSVEIVELKEFRLLTPDSEDFRKYKFNGVNNVNLQKIEKGSNEKK